MELPKKLAQHLEKKAKKIRLEVLGTVSITLEDLQKLGSGQKLLKSLAPEYPGRVRIQLVEQNKRK